jgi:hypothetical protein
VVYALSGLDGHSVNNAFQRVESGRIHRTADPNCESSQSVRPEAIIYNRKASIEHVADAQAEFCRVQCLLESFNASRNQKRSRNDVFRNSMEGNTIVCLHDNIDRSGKSSKCCSYKRDRTGLVNVHVSRPL